MNPMTNVKNITKLNEREIQLGINASCSWHKIYQKSPWVFVGGLDYELTEGDIICVFSQYGEVEDINLVRDKKTGKSKGFCFLCYQNNKSTILAVDNFNGIKLCGRTIRVDHVANYRPPKEESEPETSEEEDIMDIIDPKSKKRRKKYQKEEEMARNAKNVDWNRRGRFPNRQRGEGRPYERKYFKEERRSHSHGRFEDRNARPEDVGPTVRKRARMDSSSDESDERRGRRREYRTDGIDRDQRYKYGSKRKHHAYENHSH